MTRLPSALAWLLLVLTGGACSLGSPPRASILALRGAPSGQMAPLPESHFELLTDARLVDVLNAVDRNPELDRAIIGLLGYFQGDFSILGHLDPDLEAVELGLGWSPRPPQKTALVR